MKVKKGFKAFFDGVEEYFKPALDATYERFLFNICDQQSRESIDE